LDRKKRHLLLALLFQAGDAKSYRINAQIVFSTMQRIVESDWKHLRSMKDKKLAAACQSAFDKISYLISQSKGAEHETYLKIWKTIREEDKKIELMFDGISRSSAIFKLLAWKKYGLLSSQEESEFSSKTQTILRGL